MNKAPGSQDFFPSEYVEEIIEVKYVQKSNLFKTSKHLKGGLARAVNTMMFHNDSTFTQHFQAEEAAVKAAAKAKGKAAKVGGQPKEQRIQMQLII